MYSLSWISFSYDRSFLLSSIENEKKQSVSKKEIGL